VWQFAIEDSVIDPDIIEQRGNWTTGIESSGF
jgi:hypothetical protein